MRLPEGFVEEVRGSASIIAIVSSYVTLRKMGQGHKGLCPFHNEKTPSFNVDDGRRIFHCFGCGETGDVFKFLMLQERLAFPDAVRRVAELSGIPLPAVESKPGDDRRERLYSLNEAALTVYRETLGSATGAGARAYLSRRGITDETIERFEIGVTPEGWEGVVQALQRKGFRDAELTAVGLAKERPSGRGLYDRFHERLIFPIRNVAGRLVAFGGRALTGQEPKYLNSPETELYSKSDVLYGLNLAKDEVRKREHAVLVEGYVDLIALAQAGIGEGVASLGTSLTERHVKLLGRYATRVLVAYDGDVAGQRAAKRALSVLLPEGMKAAVVVLPKGQDPDDVVRAEGGEAFRVRMTAAQSAVRFLVGLARDADPEGSRTQDGRLRLVNEVLPILAALRDPVERALEVGQLAEAAGIEEGVLRDALKRAASERKGSVTLDRPHSGSGAERAPGEAERLLVRVLLSGPEARAELGPRLDPDDWRGLAAAPVLDALLGVCLERREITVAALIGELDGALGGAVLGALLLSGPDAELRQGLSAVHALRRARLQRELKQIQGQIGAAEATEQDALLARKQELSQLLNTLAEG